MTFHRAVITGGAGFIGSHLADRLVANGLEVIVYDNLSVGRRENVPAGATLVEADVRDVETLSTVLRGVDTVFHLAARVGIRDSCAHFTEDADVNLMGTLAVLKACAQTGPKKFILASSMAVYADSPAPRQVLETYPTAPASPYGISKLAAEKYCLNLCPLMGIKPVVLRFFNTYGTRQTITSYVGVITIFIDRLLAGKPPVIFGTGTQSRDFVHVDDIAAACYLAMKSDAGGCVLNVGTGKATTVNEIAAILCERIAPTVKPVRAPKQAGELQNCVADISRIRSVLGYRPEWQLAERVDELIAYLKTK